MTSEIFINVHSPPTLLFVCVYIVCWQSSCIRRRKKVTGIPVTSSLYRIVTSLQFTKERFHYLKKCHRKKNQRVHSSEDHTLALCCQRFQSQNYSRCYIRRELKNRHTCWHFQGLLKKDCKWFSHTVFSIKLLIPNRCQIQFAYYKFELITQWY